VVVSFCTFSTWATTSLTVAREHARRFSLTPLAGIDPGELQIVRFTGREESVFMVT